MKSKKKSKQNYRIYTVVLFVIALIIAVFAGYRIVMNEEKEKGEVTARLSSAKLVYKPYDDQKVKLIMTELSIVNNLPETIGLEPNGCGFEVYLNGEKVDAFQSSGDFHFGCTEIGGSFAVVSGKTQAQKHQHSIQRAKVGDKIKLVYYYVVYKNGKHASFDRYSLDKYDSVTTNEVVIK